MCCIWYRSVLAFVICHVFSPCLRKDVRSVSSSIFSLMVKRDSELAKPEWIYCLQEKSSRSEYLYWVFFFFFFLLLARRDQVHRDEYLTILIRLREGSWNLILNNNWRQNEWNVSAWLETKKLLNEELWINEESLPLLLISSVISNSSFKLVHENTKFKFFKFANLNLLTHQLYDVVDSN